MKQGEIYVEKRSQRGAALGYGASAFCDFLNAYMLKRSIQTHQIIGPSCVTSALVSLLAACIISSTERTKEQLARVTLCHANPKIQMMFRSIGCKHKYVR